MANDHVVTDSENSNAISAKFECNICLDTVQDPVITLCGHLYCWPCIYKWFRYKQQPSSSQNLEDEITNCPVCKTDITEKDIVPLYGPSSLTANHATKNNGVNGEEMVPPRPPSTPRYRGRGGYHRLAPRPISLPGRDEMSMESVVVLSPTIGMLGEMVSGRILGDLDAPLFSTPMSYNQVTITRRERLQTTQADRSLSRVCSFLICCLLFCLVVFT